MPVRHFSQTPPDKANDLFDKLLATSDNALKTRERLFSDLRDELQLLANLQEQHLFPILERHDMNDLLKAAAADNDETNALLEELERMPKNNGEFLGKVAELRRAFQQHIRDDRKELLPAVLEVLSDEEAQAVVEQVEDEMASFEEAKRSDAGQPHDQSQLSQPIEPLKKIPEGMANMVQAGTERAQAVAVGVRDLSQECLQMSQKRLQTNLDALTQLAQCRSVQDLAKVQLSLLQDNVEQTLSNGFRIADMTVQLAEKTAWGGLRQIGRASQHSKDFA
jgi:hypothetical protein